MGCSRYQGAHAVGHFQATSHRFAIDLGSQLIWDYALDGYVNRVRHRQFDDAFYASDEDDSAEVDCNHADAVDTGDISDYDSEAEDADDFGTGAAAGTASAVSAFASSSSSSSSSVSGASGLLARSPLTEHALARSHVARRRDLLTAKVESLASGYNRLLNSQLAEQAHFFELRLVDSEREWNAKSDASAEELAAARAARDKAVQVRATSRALSSRESDSLLPSCCLFRSASRIKLSPPFFEYFLFALSILSQEADEADRERAAAERTLAQCHTRLRRRADDAAFVRALNEQLLASASHAQDAIERVRQQGERRAREAPAVRAKERQIAELERRVAEAMGAFQSE